MTEAGRSRASRSWRVRPHRGDDLDRLAEISARGFESPWSRDALAAEAALRGGALWVAVDAADGRPVGYLAARCAADQLEVTSLAVDPGRRRAGVASALLRHALAGARRQGAREAQLEVRLGNAGARAFYAARGFSVRGRRPGYYPSRGPGALREDALLLSRSLVVAAAPS